MSIDGVALSFRARYEGAARWLRILREDFRIFGRGFWLVVRPATLMATAYLAVGAFVTLTPIAQVLLAKLVVDSLAARVATEAITFAILYTITLIVPSVAERIQEALTSSLGARAVAEVDYHLIGKAARLVDLGHIERPAYQDQVQLMRENAYWAPQLFAYLQWTPGRLLTLVGVLALLISLHPLIPLALAVSGGLSLMAQRRLNILKWEATQNRTRAAREMDYCTQITTQSDAAKEVRIFGLGDVGLPTSTRQYRSSTCLGGLYTVPTTSTKRTCVCERSSCLPTMPVLRSRLRMPERDGPFQTRFEPTSSCGTWASAIRTATGRHRHRCRRGQRCRQEHAGQAADSYVRSR